MRTFVRLARLAGWNAALILAGLALVAVAGEAYLRLSGAFVASALPLRFVPGVGLLYEPHAEVRHTNGLDYWTIQRANSLGFLDREPPDPERAAASCHVAVIGDSFVDAKEVAIADKLHVRLEALAAAVLPELDVTTSAYAQFGTAQASQLPLYDRYARPLRPEPRGARRPSERLLGQLAGGEGAVVRAGPRSRADALRPPRTHRGRRYPAAPCAAWPAPSASP